MNITRSRRTARAAREANPEGRMPLIEHIRELRGRLLKAVGAVIVGMVAGWLVFDPVFDFLIEPYCKLPQSRALKGECNLVVNGIFDQFFVQLKVAVIVGLLLASPVWLYQLWAFVAPGLHRRERRWTYVFMGAAIPLFAMGALLAYVILDRGLAVLLGVLGINNVLALITVDAYLSYAVTMLLVFGLTFELPLFVVILNMAGVLTHERIKRWRSWIILLIFAFAAVVTPDGSPIGMLALGIPTVFLFEVSELLAFLHDRRKARQGGEYDDLSDDEASSIEAPEPIEADAPLEPDLPADR
jgi:sec-independent protein translocase protein TatC